MDIFKNLTNSGRFSGDNLDKMLIQFCFMKLIQNELDEVATTWNAYLIRPIRGHSMPSGRRIVMYSLPELYSSTDYLIPTTDERLQICNDECTFRGRLLCNADFFEWCLLYMEENAWRAPEDITSAVELYTNLRMAMHNDM